MRLEVRPGAPGGAALVDVTTQLPSSAADGPAGRTVVVGDVIHPDLVGDASTIAAHAATLGMEELQAFAWRLLGQVAIVRQAEGKAMVVVGVDPRQALVVEEASTAGLRLRSAAGELPAVFERGRPMRLLPPGSMLTWGPDDLTIESWLPGQPTGTARDDLVRELRIAVNAVLADTPIVSVACSPSPRGIVALAARQCGAHRTPMYLETPESVGSAWRRAVRKRLEGTRVRVTNAGASPVVPRLDLHESLEREEAGAGVPDVLTNVALAGTVAPGGERIAALLAVSDHYLADAGDAVPITLLAWHFRNAWQVPERPSGRRVLSLASSPALLVPLLSEELESSPHALRAVLASLVPTLLDRDVLPPVAAPLPPTSPPLRELARRCRNWLRARLPSSDGREERWRACRELLRAGRWSAFLDAAGDRDDSLDAAQRADVALAAEELGDVDLAERQLSAALEASVERQYVTRLVDLRARAGASELLTGEEIGVLGSTWAGDTTEAKRVARKLLVHDGFDHVLELDARLLANGHREGLPRHAARARAIARNVALATDGVAVPDRVGTAASSRPRARPRVLMLLHNSLPHASGGYATRAHGILKGLRTHVDVTAATRAGFPGDTSPDLPPAADHQPSQIDGVTYRRLGHRSRGIVELTKPVYIDENESMIAGIVDELQPDLVHAASFHTTGLPAMRVARERGLPFAYEVRGLYYVTKLSRDPAWANSRAHQVERTLEAQACREADVVFTLTEGMRDEVLSFGVDPSRVHLAPNSVDPAAFAPLPRDHELADRLGVVGRRVFGYVGSAVDYEGLDDLVAAIKDLASTWEPSALQLLVVGDGAELPRLQGFVQEHHLEPWVIFTGRVPHEEVARHYSIMDALVLPRKPLPVCELVSPMKPFEAMAMEIPVVASSVRALAEIVGEDRGWLFEKGSRVDLVRVLDHLGSTEDAVLKETAQTAGAWVRTERTWDRVAQTMAEAYNRLL